MRYVYTLEWCLTGAGYRHVSSYSSAREAIAAARLAYAALYVTIGRGNPEHSGGDSPAIFNAIRGKNTARVAAEPRNKSFVVSIAKRGR